MPARWAGVQCRDGIPPHGVHRGASPAPGSLDAGVRERVSRYHLDDAGCSPGRGDGDRGVAPAGRRDTAYRPGPPPGYDVRQTLAQAGGLGHNAGVSAPAAGNDLHAFPGRLITVLAIGVVVVAMYGARAFPVFPDARVWLSPPDLASIDDTDMRKTRFLEFLRPVVEHVNTEVGARRERLLRIERRAAEGRMTRADRAWLERMAAYYRVEADEAPARIARLKRRIDIVPPALALAQAAIESGWGTSRFAREGNNLFGQWCFEPGCGIVPRRRAGHASYEVRSFPTVVQSVRSYMRNLNSHPAYRELRERRHQAREAGHEPRAAELAAGLERYSERGGVYVGEVRAIIRANGLEDLARAG